MGQRAQQAGMCCIWLPCSGQRRHGRTQQKGLPDSRSANAANLHHGDADGCMQLAERRPSCLHCTRCAPTNRLRCCRQSSVHNMAAREVSASRGRWAAQAATGGHLISMGMLLVTSSMQSRPSRWAL